MAWSLLICAALLWLVAAVYRRLKKLRKYVDEQKSRITKLRKQHACLQEEQGKDDTLIALENKIAFFSTALTDMILRHNEALNRFPANFIAPLFGHQQQFLEKPSKDL